MTRLPQRTSVCPIDAGLLGTPKEHREDSDLFCVETEEMMLKR